jgi:nicotinate-nucleotide pyrophosphorylase (carboxylating)
MVRQLLRLAVEEDLGPGDITTAALLPPQSRTRAAILAKSDLVVSGLGVARAVFRLVDPALRIRFLRRDGERARPGEPLLELEGRAAAILAGERLALNFLQRMSGIATLTARFVARVGPGGPAILDTRKTAPGLRLLDKYAVACGGGVNHRMGLYDQILIKDNHRGLWKSALAGSLARAVAEARRRFPGRVLEIEVESLAELRDAIREKPDWILLDNMTPAQIRRCVRETAGRCRLEASGGITLRTIRRVAATGVDAISLGCLTHSAPAADLSLELASDHGPGSRRRHRR